MLDTVPGCYFIVGNGDGKPDGDNGAVWAGLLVDAEGAQKFSSSQNTADGDNNDGLNDEDGLVFPALSPLR